MMPRWRVTANIHGTVRVEVEAMTEEHAARQMELGGPAWLEDLGSVQVDVVSVEALPTNGESEA